MGGRLTSAPRGCGTAEALTGHPGCLKLTPQIARVALRGQQNVLHRHLACGVLHLSNDIIKPAHRRGGWHSAARCCARGGRHRGEASRKHRLRGQQEKRERGPWQHGSRKDGRAVLAAVKLVLLYFQILKTLKNSELVCVLHARVTCEEEEEYSFFFFVLHAPTTTTTTHPPQGLRAAV